mgnify:CR=1 FL=1
MTDPAVEVLDLSRSFGPLEALTSLSFSVGRGELFGLVGPDGAGKTTLLRILAGVLRPTEGEARVLGISLTGDPERAKPHLAYMPQRFGLYEDLTVQDLAERFLRAADHSDYRPATIKLFRNTLEEIRDETYLRRATFLLWVGHNLERIGDRATNIAERVIFTCTGEFIEIDQDLDESDYA